MKQSSEKIHEPPTRLQQDILDRIVRLIHDEAPQPGTRLNENRLAQQLGVSRTPIRAAIEQLAAGGYVERQPNRGVEIIAIPPMPDTAHEADQDDDLLVVRIANDHERKRLPSEISETQLMRLYGLSRHRVRSALARLADLGVIERKAGYGWRFAETFQDANADSESYRFRMLIEPAAILEPGFKLSADWLEEMRGRHEAAVASSLAGQWTPSSSIAFFEMNAAFHDGIGEASGNRYLAHAVRRQTKLRRLSNYNWSYGEARVLVNSREHLEILERLGSGDQELAAVLMRRHLLNASLVRSSIDSHD